MLTWERLKEVLHYDPETGIFTWRVSQGRSKAGTRAKTKDQCGYLKLRIDTKRYFVQRLAWLYMTGAFPPEPLVIDHKDQNKLNNRWSNLHLVTRKGNAHNRGPCKLNSSGIRGVTYVDRLGKWRAVITANGKYKVLGYSRYKGEAALYRFLGEIEAGYDKYSLLNSSALNYILNALLMGPVKA